MGWVKGTIIAAGVLSATVALAAYGQANKADKSDAAGPDRQDRQTHRERVIVTPQIRVFDGDRAQLGVSLRDLDEASAKEHKLQAADGALVERVEPDSAAEKAGIKQGDVITSFDGERVRSVRHLQRLVSDTPPDRPVKMTVVRDGRKVELTATPAKGGGRLLPGVDDLRFDELERNLDQLRDLPRAFRYEWRDDQAPGDVLPLPRTPRGPAAPRSPFGDALPRRGLPRFPFNGWTSGAGRLGVVVQDLSPQLREYFGGKEGVLVSSVTEGSPAAHAGIKAGDVITKVNGKDVTDADSLVRIVRSQPDGQELTIDIVRDHKPQALKVKLLDATNARPI
jgi:serine protease Do